MSTLTQFRHDYTASAFTLDSIELTFDIEDAHTDVKSRLIVRRATAGDLVLHGSAELRTLTLDGITLSPAEYQLDFERHTLTIPNPPDTFILEVETRLYPERNTSLMGLYASRGNLFTQCEPEGFRKITYSLDRPDVMAKYSVTLIADKTHYPVLLSNGNCVARGRARKNRHWAKWVDPYRKPSYLFALVAGQLECRSERFITASGRSVQLEIYVEARDLDKTEHAMQSLKRAMRWDEQRFGLEYDLDTYMIVAVSDFNMGAMENKGLNIFNTKYVLASPETATDADFEGIESVIGHEYFHNWTGNRVTCRDWFQLSLKEGLTVFRDQEFTADLHSRAVKRIEDVRTLRTHQFPEDAGPNAHPVRPESYIEINNFYTMTVYEKGAEVVRMYQTLLGQNGFRDGLALYFRRHDGQAVTCDDFLCAMRDANHADALNQFEHWYAQAGTPRINVALSYDAAQQCATLTLTQHCPETPNQPASEKQPFLIPFKISLLNANNGQPYPLHLANNTSDTIPTEQVLWLSHAQQSFTFTHIPDKPIPSLLRDFSAPVICEYPYTPTELAFLFTHDDDPFNRWEAGQTLIKNWIVDSLATPEPLDCTHIITAFRAVLEDERADPAFKALALTLPDELELFETLDCVHPDHLAQRYDHLLEQLGQQLYPLWLKTWRSLQRDTYQLTDSGVRRLKNLALHYLVHAHEPRGVDAAIQQFKHANNMTDSFGALSALRHTAHPEYAELLKRFAERWQHDALVMDKWFALQASSHAPNTLENVKTLMNHRAFSLKNPNKVRALFGSFGRNLRHFHQADGASYQFMTDKILEIDPLNPQVAARLATLFNRWPRLEPSRQALMKTCLERMHRAASLSNDTQEIVTKALAHTQP